MYEWLATTRTVGTYCTVCTVSPLVLPDMAMSRDGIRWPFSAGGCFVRVRVSDFLEIRINSAGALLLFRIRFDVFPQ